MPGALDRPRGGGRLSPEAVEEAFIAANPGLERKGIAVTCRQGQLEEVRICMDADLGFRPCPEVDRQGCRARTIEQPPIP